MVFFVCEDCNETLKRLKVAQHLCRCSCSAITCVDCGATFHDDSYLQHATCMSEAERYEGNLYKAPKKKNAQDAWAELVQAACADRKDAPPAAAKLLPRLQGFENIPRNQKKFCNWVKNSLNLRGGDAAAVDALWAYLVARRDAARAEAAPAPVAPAPSPRLRAPPASPRHLRAARSCPATQQRGSRAVQPSPHQHLRLLPRKPEGSASPEWPGKGHHVHQGRRGSRARQRCKQEEPWSCWR